MKVGIRDLRDNLSRYLARVRDGQVLEVTNRGRVVARIEPAGETSTLERLIAEGLVQPPRATKRPLPRPIKADGTVSDLVIEQRR